MRVKKINSATVTAEVTKTKLTTLGDGAIIVVARSKLTQKQIIHTHTHTHTHIYIYIYTIFLDKIKQPQISMTRVQISAWDVS